MEDRKAPTWEEIRGLIDRVDEVCRESEYLRAHAERVLRRPTIWPDRRREPQKHTQPGHSGRRREDIAQSKGSGGSI
jgi:hypothetical protein